MRPIVVGAGIGGLCTALELSVLGYRPILCEARPEIGGKMIPVTIDGAQIDGGPTVLTMTWVFEELFSRAGGRLKEFIELKPADRLARHFWPDGSRLDLFSDLERSRAAIEALAGSKDADGFMRYHTYAKSIFENVDDVFIRAPKPTPWRVMKTLGMKAIPRLLSIDARRTMWRALGDFFEDERLRQLFGRYATYAGNNPFVTPATFNLIAHVEQAGVWRIQGGMSRLAQAIGALIEKHGGEIRTQTNIRRLLEANGAISGVELEDGTTIESSVVVFNGDINALGKDHLGLGSKPGIKPVAPADRSLSALTLCCLGHIGDFPMIHHNVFFSADYAAEFDQIDLDGQLPDDPTIYICAQDRGDNDAPRDRERFLMLINAPGRADVRSMKEAELNACLDNARTKLRTMGLTLHTHGTVVRGPDQWNTLFPGSGGAIYGAAAKQWNATLKRHGSKTRLKGLYLTGGSIHPGAGVPMAALSGRMAAYQVQADFPLT